MINSKLLDIPPETWLEIFRYATHTPRSTTIAPLDPFIPEHPSNNVMAVNTPPLSMRTKCDLVLVCRSWRKVATELLYEHITIRSPRRAATILVVLQENAHAAETESGVKAPVNGRRTRFHISEYGKWTRHIEIYTHARRTSSFKFFQDVFQILKHCRNLRMLSGSWMWLVPAGFLQGLSELYGPSLQGLAWEENSSAVNAAFATPAFLESFHALRILDLRNVTSSTATNAYCEDDNRKTLLPNVRILLVSTHLRSLLIGIALHLPVVHRLIFEIRCTSQIPYQVFEPFILTHGPLLKELEIVSPNPSAATLKTTLDVSMFLQPYHCHSLHTLVFSQTLPMMKTISVPHTSLRRIGIRDVSISELYPMKTTQTKKHLLSFTRKSFPGLEVVRTVGFLVDADTNGLAKDIFIWWAEKFEEEGVDFQDGEGIVWLYTDPVETGHSDEGHKEGERSAVERNYREAWFGLDGTASASHYISTRIAAHRAANTLP